MEFPVILNADILTGPNSPVEQPLNGTEFLDGAKNISKSILSIGWTTG